MEVSRARVSGAANEVYERARGALAADASPSACAVLVAEVNALLETEFARLAAVGAAPECRVGCVFCCHQRVSVLPHEALALWQAWQALPVAEAAAIEQRIRANAARIDGLTVAEHYTANLPCAFLVNGRCAAYASRPSICASFHSMSRARCEDSFNRPEGIGTAHNSRPVLFELQAFSDALRAAVTTALDDAGLASAKLELHQALRALLDDSSAAQRWGAGGALLEASTAR